MDDTAVLAHINGLVDEERRLHDEEASRAGEGPDPVRAARLAEIEVALDQCWDLLRQRRARRAAGEPADDASVRDVTIVERYQQ